MAEQQLKDAHKAADKRLGTRGTENQSVEEYLKTGINFDPVKLGNKGIPLTKESIAEYVLDGRYKIHDTNIVFLSEKDDYTGLRKIESSFKTFNNPEGLKLERQIKQVKNKGKGQMLKDSKKRTRFVNDYLSENNESRVSPWVTTDMPIIDETQAKAFRKGLENELTPGNLKPSINIHIPGVKKGLPITEQIPGDAKLGGVKFATNGNILGERSWEVTYSVKNTDGIVKNVVGYVPVSQLTNEQTKEYLQLPEVKAAEALSTIKDYNLSEWTLPDLPSVTIKRKGSDKVIIDGQSFTMDDAQKIIQQYYELQAKSNELGLDLESTINLIKAQEGQ